ncbi:MAG: DUF2294 domain-containing protein [Bacteroidetes bacterium]|nr:MAG: DUF2294 domain-containing protein [Bacteroidota bacterium]
MMIRQLERMEQGGKTKGQVEAAITTAITRFEREHLGRGPREARTFIVQDMVLVRLTGILSPAEQQLASEPGGVELIKQMRSRLIESSSRELERLVEAHTGLRVVTLHADLSTRTGERIFVFTLAEDLEARFQGG